MVFTAMPSFWEQMLERPLDQRIAPAPADLVESAAKYNAATANPSQPRVATAEADFVTDLRRAIQELPLVVKKKLEPRLLGVFLMADLGSSAITEVVARLNGELIGAVVAVDVKVLLHRKANEWATWRENTPFISDPGFHLEARIAEEMDDNRQSALQYLLLHELGHVLAVGLDFMPDSWQNPSSIKAASTYTFLSLSWEVRTNASITPLAENDFPLRQSVAYYAVPQLPGSDAPEVFRDLAKTAFPTLYAATSVHEDFAECFSTYVHSLMLGKRHEISVYHNGKLAATHAHFWMADRSQKKAEFFRTFFNQPASPFSLDRHLQKSQAHIEIIHQAETTFLGLAPFLRMNLAGEDLEPVVMDLLDKAGQHLENANLWMNLATALLSNKLRENGLSVQQQALIMQRLYPLSSTGNTGRFKLLVLMAAGDLGANTPLDCLLAVSDIDLIFYYATVAFPLPVNVPAHDALYIAMADGESTRPILKELESLLKHWDKPVINAPQHIPNTERSMASDLLRDIPGLLMPPTREIMRDVLQAITTDAAVVSDLFDGCRFPIIVRPISSHAGRDLARIDDSSGLVDYLLRVKDTSFYVSCFIDYSGEDGLFRKCRIALIGGQPYACHMAVSSHWIIHYVNAGMYEDAGKRAEEASFMENFADFALRHAGALRAVYERSELDYVCIDCSETRDGRLLIFEIDHAMVVHAMDAQDMFPHKQLHMKKVRNAFEEFLFSRKGRSDVLGVT